MHENMNAIYHNLLTEIMNGGTTEVNERTGVSIKMTEGARSFMLDLSTGYLPVPGNRAYFPSVAAAEVAWQFMGTKDPSFILQHAPKLWSKFLEPDDEGNDELKTAYGYRWRKAFGRDQLELAMYELAHNPTNRQLWVQAWDPSADGLGGPQPKNIPCPIGFSVSRSKDKVHMSLFIRSSDVFVGLPYDIMAYSMTLAAIASSIDCKPGYLHVTLAHPHLYEPHWEYADQSLSTVRVPGESFKLPEWSVYDIEATPNAFVESVKSQKMNRNPWNPLPEVIV